MNLAAAAVAATIGVAGTSAHAALTYNAFTANVLTHNALNSNALNPNALNPNALNPNALNFNVFNTNALTAGGAAIDDLNGVAVEAVTPGDTARPGADGR
jgi:hypothetical protein